VSYTKKELKNYLKGLLKEKAGLTNFSFEYQSGHTAFHSRLRIILTSQKIEHWKVPKGTPIDSAEEKKVAKIRKMEFSPEKMLVFMQELVKKKIWDLENCTERAMPGTVMLSFSIKDDDNLLFEQKIWGSCRNDDKRTKELIRALATNIPLDWTPP